MTAHGASRFALSSPMQRIRRDSNTSARHAVLLTPIDLGAMTDAQTACMRLLDDDGTLPGPAWG